MKGTMTILGLCLAVISGNAAATGFTEWTVGKHCNNVFSLGTGEHKDTQVLFTHEHGITIHLFNETLRPVKDWEVVDKVDGRLVTFVVTTITGQLMLVPKSREGQEYLLSRFYNKDEFSVGKMVMNGKGFRKALAEQEKCKPL